MFSASQQPCTKGANLLILLRFHQIRHPFDWDQHLLEVTGTHNAAVHAYIGVVLDQKWTCQEKLKPLGQFFTEYRRGFIREKTTST